MSYSLFAHLKSNAEQVLLSQRESMKSIYINFTAIRYYNLQSILSSWTNKINNLLNLLKRKQLEETYISEKFAKHLKLNK